MIQFSVFKYSYETFALLGRRTLPPAVEFEFFFFFFIQTSTVRTRN